MGDKAEGLALVQNLRCDKGVQRVDSLLKSLAIFDHGGGDLGEVLAEGGDGGLDGLDVDLLLLDVGQGRLCGAHP